MATRRQFIGTMSALAVAMATRNLAAVGVPNEARLVGVEERRILFFSEVAYISQTPIC